MLPIMKSMPPRLLLLAFAFFTTAACAQPMFRSVMPDGKIVYGDKPAPGAKESKQLNLPPLNVSTPGPAQAPAGAADAPPAAGGANPEVAAARQNLDAAKKALEAGREPLPGERSGIANKGGGTNSRLNETYTQRIKTLEDAVTAAQTQLEEAQRNAAR